MNPKSDQDNHANQLNDNNDVYWQSRGYEDRDDAEEQGAVQKEEDEE